MEHNEKNVAGKSFEELSDNDMKKTQGAGDDVAAETFTPAAVSISASVAVTTVLLSATTKK